MSIDEFEQMWIDAGNNLEDLVFNKYVISNNDEGYVNAFKVVLDDKYDFYGQMSLYPEATEGWVKFIADKSECRGYFEVDENKKDKIIAERERQAQLPTWNDTIEAQVTYTALMTDTLIEEA